MDNIYQVFIASTLQIENHRKATIDAIAAANDDYKVKLHHIQFKHYLYEKRSDNLQKIEKTDAQEPADNELKESTLFFLIIDDVIRSMTQHEFWVALEQFKHGGDPQYIFILYNNKPTESNGEGLDYKDFINKYNLEYYVADCHNEIVPHSKVYAIPFTDIDNLKERIQDQLIAFALSKYRPPHLALRSYNLTKNHFFTDILRKEKCPEAYFRRNFDDLLDSAISEGKRNFVALIGYSLSGKTRAVMEAMKATDDGWVYIVNMKNAVTEFGKLENYLKLPGHPKLYIVLDDYSHWAGQKQVSDALNDLLRMIKGSNDVIVATASTKNNLPDKDDQYVEWIEIKEMDEREFGEVRDFFVSAGVNFDKGNLRYHCTGALFVNLKEIKYQYTKWLNQEDDTELMRQARKMILKAIKALSIWRDDNIGNRMLMEDLASWLCTKEMKKISRRKKIEWNEADIPEICHVTLDDLIQDKRKGVSSDNEGTQVIVQEYIYRYFLDYDGFVLDDEQKFSCDKEKTLVRELLLFCNETQKQEPLTAQVSRLCRRCTFRKETVSWLYKLWIGTGEIESPDIPLSKLLHEDRTACERNHEKRITHLYSNVLETYIYSCCETIEEARQAYDQCPQEMLTDHLFSALMRKAKTQEEREKIRKIAYYTDHKNDAYIIAVETEWADCYGHAKEWLKRFSLYEKSPQKMAIYLLETEYKVGNPQRSYNLIQLRRSVNTLATKVNNVEDFEDYCNLVGYLYLYLTDDVELLRDIRSKQKQYNPKELTRIDLLAILQPYALTRMLGNVFGGDLTASEVFVKRLLDDVKKTLAGRFTDEHALRLTFGYTLNKLIRKLADVPYEEVYNHIFKRLVIETDDKTLILRNIYTYTAMLGNNSCDMQRANDLLLTDLHHQMQDIDNPITVNTITLNMIMEKSGGKNRGFNVDIINNIYDQLHRKRDSFTYRYLLSATTNLEQALGILKEMRDRKVEPNVYVLCELMKRPFIKLRTALTMVDLTNVNIPEKYKLWPIEPIEGFDSKDIIAGLRKSMSDTHIAWGCLFKKKCRGKSDKEVLTECLSMLEKMKSELLENGYVYNCLISNESYLPFVNDVKNFIDEKKKLLNLSSFPDFYTAKLIIDRITQLNGQDRLKAIERLNDVLEMVMDRKKCRLDHLVVRSRLRIYHNQTEILKMDFYNNQGEKILEKGEPLKLNVIDYLQKMSINGYPIDSYSIKSYLAIVDGLTPNPFSKLVKEIPEVNLFLNTPSVHNNMLLWQYKAKKISIDYTFENLDWTNFYPAICKFGDILNCYIDSLPMSHDRFEKAKALYTQWITDKDRPTTSIILAVLAKATSNWESDMKWLLDEFKKQLKKNPMLSLTPQMLSAMSAYANTVHNLIQWTDIMFQKGCPPSSKAADFYVLRMAGYLLQHDYNATAPILDDLCQYIVEGGNENDKSEKLILYKRNSLMLDLYKDPKNISSFLLRSLIYYNAAETRKYTVEEMIKCIKEKYKGCIIPLMEMLAADVSDRTSILPLRENMEPADVEQIVEKTAHDYIPQLFVEINKHNKPSLSKRLLSYLAFLLPTANLDGYRQFLKQLYEMDCHSIEGAVPGLAVCLKKYVDSHPNSNDVPTAHKALARIIVYTKLKKIRNRDLLLDGTPEEWLEEHAVCCHYLMDCETMMTSKGLIWRELINKQWSDLIRNYTYWLDDAYPCSLMLCNKKVNKEHPLPDETKTIISHQEHSYARKIEAGEVYLKHVLELPLLWIKAKWRPSEELALAMVRCISRMAYNPNPGNTHFIENYIDNARKRCDAILESFKSAIGQKTKSVSLYYKDIGRDVSKDNNYSVRISLLAMRALEYDMALDRMAYSCAKGTCMTKKDCETLKYYEMQCASYIKVRGADIIWLQQLPKRWARIKVGKCRMKNNFWRPDDSMVIAILKKYVQLAQCEGDDVAKARKYVKNVRSAIDSARKKKYPKVRIKYSMLGIIEENEISLFIPLKYISKEF